jgi:hypothetical protein
MHPVTFEADRLHEQSGPHCKGPSGVIDLQQALDIVRQALLACDVAGSKALAGAFASFVDEPDKLVFQSHLMSLLETKAGAMEKHWDKAV